MTTHSGYQRVCAWSEAVCVVLFFAAFVVAGWIPPMAPSLSAEQVAAFYQQHTMGIRIGGVLMFLSGGFYAVYTAVISAQMTRIRNVSRTAVFAQLCGGAFACLTFMVPAMLFLVTAYRPERLPSDTQLLNDMSWILLVMAWPPFAAQQLSFVYAILADRSAQPVFPRWLGYLNIWVVLGFVPASILAFFQRPVRVERVDVLLDTRHSVLHSVRRQRQHGAASDQKRRSTMTHRLSART